MKQILFFVVIAVQCILLPHSVAAQKNEDVFTQHAKDIAAIEKYLSNMTSLRSKFSQVNPGEGTLSKGEVFVFRPGLARWDYVYPTPAQIFVDKKQAVYYEQELEQTTYMELDSLLTEFLSHKEISFNDGPFKVTELIKDSRTITISLIANTIKKDSSEEAVEFPETLTLVFATDPLELTKLYWTDSGNETTMVSLLNPEFNVTLADDTFIFNKPKPKRKR